jgi:hypothetical protein
MKWIGQHIYDLVARFRNDVYLEDLSTTTETNVLVVDSDGKVSKTTVITGDVTGVTAGDNITVTDPTGPVPTVALNTSLTGLTSVTSTSFVGSLTGNADTATKIDTITNSDIVQLTGTQTLTSKTLNRPIIENYARFLGGTSGGTNVIATAVAGSTILTLPAATDTLVGRATTDILTNKTLTTPRISSIFNTGTLTLPTSTDTLVGKDTTDTLTNKNVQLTVEDKSSSYTLAAADAGKIIDLTASGSSIEVPISVFFPGDRITITNSYTGGGQTISAASGCTLYYNGTAYVGASFNLPARKMLIFHCTVGGANPVFFSQS